ncbi:MAG: histidine phosphatase family protein [Armatimonadetes bacterium]|nr:histidine phosphatase family protein [Armatimonadota bacterium]
MNDEQQRTTLILVRHGETEWNTERRVQGQVDSQLTARGRAQARQAAERLAETDVRAIDSSDSGRARETAELIAAPHGLVIAIHAGLRERSYGILEGKTVEEAAREDTGWLEAWRADRLRLAPPEGETQPELSQRVMSALREIVTAHPGEQVVVSTHGGPVKSAVFDILQIPVSSWDRTWIANGSITVLVGTPERLLVAAFNDTCHLDEEPAPRRHV